MGTRYSIVIPVHNEEGNLDVLCAELDAAIAALDGAAEVIAVDDGSTDGSRAVLEALRLRYAWLRLLCFARRSGQSAAMFAGMRHARGDVIITMDADLQNDPADIAALLACWPEYDVVVGRRVHRRDSLVRRWSSRVGNGVRNFVTRETIADTGCSLKLFARESIAFVPLFNGMHRFLPTLCRMHGARVKEVPVSHRPRLSGTSHYGIRNRALRGLADVMGVRWLQARSCRYTIERLDA
jgi:dolichol-phosphate mannosyltransferase